MDSCTSILAFDFGLKRIGVAVGNRLIKQAQPLCIIHAERNDEKFSQIEKLFKEWMPSYCVVGVPYHPDGAEHEMTARCKRFANQLNGRLGVQVVLVDERYSSVVLGNQQGKYVDDESAAIILQQHLNDPHAMAN